MTASFSASNLYAQDHPLEAFKWKHRIVLLISESEHHPSFLEQRLALGNLDTEFDDRKLLVFQVQKKKFRILNPPVMGATAGEWKTDDSLYSVYGQGQESFRVVLIGLDGGIKLQQTEVLSRKALFDRIDAMPMRRSEMKKKY